VKMYEKTIKNTETDYWTKATEDKKGNIIKFEDSDGYWVKITRDENGKPIFYENSLGNSYSY